MIKNANGDIWVGEITADSPEPSDETVEVRARTGYGDIVIRRS
ncbi:MAG: hypothetical protein ACRDRT_18925 [Pseudonocardiaceae bacterium]